jgi:hypothetical protein
MRNNSRHGQRILTKSRLQDPKIMALAVGRRGLSPELAPENY